MGLGLLTLFDVMYEPAGKASMSIKKEERKKKELHTLHSRFIEFTFSSVEEILNTIIDRLIKSYFSFARPMILACPTYI
jgi:hypothetical protein